MTYGKQKGGRGGTNVSVRGVEGGEAVPLRGREGEVLPSGML